MRARSEQNAGRGVAKIMHTNAGQARVRQRLEEGTLHDSLLESSARAIGEDQCAIRPPLGDPSTILLPLALLRQADTASSDR